MKNIITFLTFLIFLLPTLRAETNPEVLFANEKVLIEVSVGELAIFKTASYDAESENLSFTTTEDIAVIQVFNKDGELEFQLPVMSNKVKINKNLFDKGSSQLGFILEGESQLHTTHITVK